MLGYKPWLELMPFVISIMKLLEFINITCKIHKHYKH